MGQVTFEGTTISDGNVSFDFTKGVLYDGTNLLTPGFVVTNIRMIDINNSGATYEIYGIHTEAYNRFSNKRCSRW